MADTFYRKYVTKLWKSGCKIKWACNAMDKYYTKDFYTQDKCSVSCITGFTTDQQNRTS